MAARKKAVRKKASGRKAAKRRVGSAQAAKLATTVAAWSQATKGRTATSKTAKTGAGKGAAKRAAAKPAGKSSVSGKQVASGKQATARKKAVRRKLAGGAVARQGSANDPALLGELEALASMMDAHGLVEVSYELDSDGSKRIHVSRQSHGPVAAPAALPAVAAAPAAPEAAAPPAPPPEENLVPFTSPMVGTFYRAPSPEAAPFVSVGDHIDPASVVCIIEAMKVMNEVNPDVSGEVVSIEVENGEAVEFGQTLMLLRPR